MLKNVNLSPVSITPLIKIVGMAMMRSNSMKPDPSLQHASLMIMLSLSLEDIIKKSEL
jgi:hypothetical protein